MKCKKCGTQLRSDDEFCYRCGQRTTIWQRLFASRAIIGSTIAILVVACATVLTWLILSGRLDLSSLKKNTEDNPGTDNIITEEKTSGNKDPESGKAPDEEPPKETAAPTPEPTPAIVYPADVTKTMKTQMKGLTARMEPFLSFCAAYYENGRHAFKWDDVSATVMALYNLEYLDNKVKYGTPYASIQKKTKKEMKDIFGSNAKYNFTYGGSFPDYVFVKTGDTVVYNVNPITGRTYRMKVEKIIEYKEGKYRVIASAGLVSETNKNDKGYIQKYTIYTDKEDGFKYGFVIRKIKLYEKKDDKKVS